MKQSPQRNASSTTGPAVGYAVAVAGTAAAALLRWVIGQTVGEIPPFITFYPVTILSAVIGGRLPGLLATLLTALAAAFFFIEPRGQLAIVSTPDAVGLAIFIAVNITLSLIGGRLWTTHQRVKAQNAQLQRNDEQLRLQTAALQSAANAIIITGRDGAIQWVNEAFTLLTGYTATEAIGQNPRLLKSGKQDAAFYKQMWETILAGRVWHGEVVNKRKDGALYTEEMTITPLTGAHGEITRFIAIKQNVTERKQAQQALTREKRFSELAINSLPGVFYLVDAHNRLRLWNKNLESVSGYSAEEVPRMTALEFLAPDDRTAASEAITKVLATGEAIAELRFLTKNGDTIPYVFTGKRFGFDGQLGFLGVGLDITERKQAEAKVADLNECLAADLADLQRLQEISTRFLASQGDLKSLLESVLDAALTIAGAAKGHIQLLNDTTGELGIITQQGYDPAFVEFFSHIRPGTVACGTAVQTRQCVIVEDVTLSPLFLAEPRALQLVLGAGVRAMVCTPLLAHTGQLVGVLSAHFAATHRPSARDLRLLDVLARQAADFVERAQAEAALREARDQLAHANADLELKVQERTAKLRESIAELEGFSYSLTHDMRAPLRAMQGFATLAEEECAACGHPQSHDYFRRIKASSDRLDRLIQDALDYSKVLREELPLIPVDAATLLHGIIESYPDLQPPGADISLEFDHLVLLGNESALTQVFSNLLGNAVKFVAPGVKPRVRIWAEAGDVERGSLEPESVERRSVERGACEFGLLPHAPPAHTAAVRIWIEDNGIGIPKQAHEKIFVMFQRMHRAEEYPGTGIGLALVRKAIERMGGQVGLESEPGKGSRFWIELPKGAASENISGMEKAA